MSHRSGETPSQCSSSGDGEGTTTVGSKVIEPLVAVGKAGNDKTSLAKMGNRFEALRFEVAVDNGKDPLNINEEDNWPVENPQPITQACKTIKAKPSDGLIALRP